MSKLILLCLGVCFLTQIQGLSFLKNNFLREELTKPEFGGGWNCMLCSLVVSQSIAYSQTHEVPIDDFLRNKLCTLFKAPISTVCQGFINSFGDIIINSLNESKSADQACNDAKLCDNPQCMLIINQTTSDLKFSSPQTARQLFTNSEGLSAFDPWKELLKLMFAYEHDQKPDVDFDNDTFSKYSAVARGYNWKGRDCDDLNPNIYPGRATHSGSNSVDYNCNGIYGINQTLNQPWEEILCANSSQIGVAVLGDSAGAHFEMAGNWFNGSSWNETTFDNLVPRFYDEMDLPQFSAYTSHYLEGYTGPAHSIYQYMYQRNKCNFRDYQNGGVNGCKAIDEIHYMNNSWKRNQKEDYPVLLFLELIGNDVCMGGDQMTTVEAFQSQIQEVLNILDTQLPAGSHVVLVGLADGELIYTFTNDRLHPVGATYANVYNYISCIGINPCPGWLTTNATTRNITQQRANNLTAVLQQFATSGKSYQNYDLTFFSFPAEEILNSWISQGGDPMVLIEPVDGFHPSQTFNSLLADYFWNELQTNYSNWIGPVNPNNNLIANLFGDQGGY